MQAFINAKNTYFSMKLRDLLQLLAAIIICQLAGAIGTLFTLPSIGAWYSLLEKPFFTPPNWVFGPVWISLYTLMGIAVFIIWKNGTKQKENKTALTFFRLQLILNATWSIVFFGMQNILLGLINIVFLWILILLTTIRFYKIDSRAGYIMIPYLLWVSLATALNAFLFILN
jgi:tryptophan-rich sensory protein